MWVIYPGVWSKSGNCGYSERTGVQAHACRLLYVASRERTIALRRSSLKITTPVSLYCSQISTFLSLRFSDRKRAYGRCGRASRLSSPIRARQSRFFRRCCDCGRCRKQGPGSNRSPKEAPTVKVTQIWRSVMDALLKGVEDGVVLGDRPPIDSSEGRFGARLKLK